MLVLVWLVLSVVVLVAGVIAWIGGLALSGLSGVAMGMLGICSSAFAIRKNCKSE
jgi:hypothetical protein